MSATRNGMLERSTFEFSRAGEYFDIRELQGNALNTILGIPVGLGVRAPVYVEACGVRHRIEVGPDPAGEVRVKHETRPVPLKPGTLIAVALPADRCKRTRFATWCRAF